jgi:hypothetical protein
VNPQLNPERKMSAAMHAGPQGMNLFPKSPMTLHICPNEPAPNDLRKLA